MSKSRGNIVSPDEIILKYGADTARLFTLFASPPEKDLEWSHDGVEGIFRFLNRVWRLVAIAGSEAGGKTDRGRAEKELTQLLHAAIKKVTADIDRFNFNTAISAIMELVNAVYRYFDEVPAGERVPGLLREVEEAIVVMLAPFAPHISEELWAELGNDYSVHRRSWPSFDEKLAAADQVTLVVQVNGKVRDRVTVDRGTSQEHLEELAFCADNVKRYIDGKEIVKVICIPDKLVNIVIK